MPAPITIAGVGLVTPLGHSAWSTWRALLDGKCLTDRCAALPPDVAPVDLVRSVGCVSVSQHISADPTVELAERAARQAIDEAGVEPDALPVVLGVSKGAVADINAYARGPVSLLSRGLHERLPLGDTRQIVAACASSLVAVHMARRWMQHDNLAAVLVITAEAALQPVFIHSYARLGVLPALDVDRYRCRPLDESRCGFVLTEVGAAVLLTRDGAGPVLADTAVACEANDAIRAPSDRSALRHVAGRLLRQPVDLLHPHATGTIENDQAELATYAQASDTQQTDVYAAKGALGHGLGSAGLTSLALAAVADRTQRRPPMPWLATPMRSAFAMSFDGPKRPIARQAIFAAGFGGHVAGVVIEKR